MVKCKCLSIDCQENTDSTDVKCGGPEYLGFDFWIDEAKFDETVPKVIEHMEQMNIPILRYYVSAENVLPNEKEWNLDRITTFLNKHAHEYVNFEENTLTK